MSAPGVHAHNEVYGVILQKIIAFDLLNQVLSCEWIGKTELKISPQFYSLHFHLRAITRDKYISVFII